MSGKTYLYNSYQDFLCYVLIHIAEADNEISLPEKTSILEKTGHTDPVAIHNYYLKQSEAERNTYLAIMQTQWINTNEAKKQLLKDCVDVMDADNYRDFLETAAYEQLIDLLYG